MQSGPTDYPLLMPCMQVVFHDHNGRELQAFDYSTDSEPQDFCCCTFNPSGDTAVVGAFNRMYVYSFNSSKNMWEQVAVKKVSCYLIKKGAAAIAADSECLSVERVQRHLGKQQSSR